MGAFDELRAANLSPAETIQRIKAIVTGWWPDRADEISAAFGRPEVQQFAISAVFANHDERRARIVFRNLLGLQDGAQVAKTAEA